jgi:hypothetical protein
MYGVESSPLPNGADVAALRSVPTEKVVMGHIGNHGSFTAWTL